MIVAREVLRDRVEAYIDHHPDATVPEVLGRFLVDPTDADHRALVEDVLSADRGAPSDADSPREVEA